ncbi:hypothetical protein RsS62_27270 [Rhizobium dioscoreae]|nr:hypothetical protein RsS62_27270 [Rhizobium dioscoreae]
MRMRRTHARVTAAEGFEGVASEQSDMDAITSMLTGLASPDIDAITYILNSTQEI